MSQQFVYCPYEDCGVTIEVEALNCKIFRCAIFKATGLQLNPHASQAECAQLIATGAIYGCGRPLKIDYNQQGHLESQICDYI